MPLTCAPRPKPRDLRHQGTSRAVLVGPDQQVARLTAPELRLTASESRLTANRASPRPNRALPQHDRDVTLAVRYRRTVGDMAHATPTRGAVHRIGLCSAFARHEQVTGPRAGSRQGARG